MGRGGALSDGRRHGRFCPRVIDRPNEMLGLQNNDIAICLIVTMLTCYALNELLGMLGLLSGLGFGFFFGLSIKKFTTGKPPGHLMHSLQGNGYMKLITGYPSGRKYKIYSPYLKASKDDRPKDLCRVPEILKDVVWATSVDQRESESAIKQRRLRLLALKYRKHDDFRDGICSQLPYETEVAYYLGRIARLEVLRTGLIVFAIFLIIHLFDVVNYRDPVYFIEGVNKPGFVFPVFSSNINSTK